jgi:hypothetical protein
MGSLNSRERVTRPALYVAHREEPKRFEEGGGEGREVLDDKKNEKKNEK